MQSNEKAMRLGIVGRSGAGKQAVFEALTGIEVGPGGKNQDHMGTIRVPDDRVVHLSHHYRPRKTTYAQVEYFLPGHGGQPESGHKGGDASAGWTKIRNSDALIHVLRRFSLYQMDAPAPERDFNHLEEELILADLMVVEKRLERLEKDQKRGKKASVEEIDLLNRCRALLEQETPLRKDPELVQAIPLKGFAFLSAKPQLVLFNNPEDDPEMPALPASMAEENCMAIRAQLERELSQMDAEEADLFFSEFDIEKVASERVIQRSYILLGLVSFFTVSDDEVRAWTIKKGTPAVAAAGTIHSDMQQGFIRAEVLAFDDLKACGSYKEARNQGLVRLEGKTYLVQDGDIINVRFNV